MQEFEDGAREIGVDRLRVEASAKDDGAIRFYREMRVEDYTITLKEDF
jgi:hypothetical protein